MSCLEASSSTLILPCAITNPVAITLTFEHPLNERARTLMRLEHLFEKLSFFQPLDNPWAARAMVETLLDIAAVSSRADIKTELIKELDRQSTNLERFRDQPGVNRKALDSSLSELNAVAEGLRNQEGPVGQRVRENEFLKGVAQRGSLPGGTCSFDLPQYHLWLSRPFRERDHQVSLWMEDLVAVRNAIQLLLSYIRTSAAPRRVQAREGLYQESLEGLAPAHLIRIAVQGDPLLYPEISGHKNRFAIRFLRTSDQDAPEPIREDLEFSLACCVL